MSANRDGPGERTRMQPPLGDSEKLILKGDSGEIRYGEPE